MIKPKIRAILVFAYALFLSIVPNENLFSQITVSGSNGLDGAYTNLTQVGGLFDILNNSNQQNAAIQIVLDADLTAEDGAIALVAGGWNQLTITASTAVSVVSNLPGALLTFDGASNVLIDGALILGTPSIRWVNTNNSSVARTIQMINGASNNQIKNCTIVGASQSTGTGTLVIGQTDDLQACSNNQVLNCSITSEYGNWAQQAIYISGNAANASNDFLIAQCLISNYFAVADTSIGIAVKGAVNNIQILGNRFFQTAAPVVAGNIYHAAIYAKSNLIKNVLIDSNIIGYENETEQGLYNLTGAGNVALVGIALATDNTQWNTLTRNRISGWKTTFTQIGGNFSFTAIEVATGKANIGGIDAGNIIGDRVIPNSLYLQSLHGSAQINGIWISSSDSNNVQYNAIAGLNLYPHDTATVAFSAIWASGLSGNVNIQFNSIGNELAPIAIGSSLQYKGAALIKVIYLSGSGSQYTAAKNNIEHVVSFSTANSGTNYLAGIEAHRGVAKLDSNTIHDLIFHGNTQSAFANRGILMRSNIANNRIIGNLIYNLSAVSDTASNVNVIAIHHSTGTCIVSGNTCFSLTNKAVGGYVAGIWKTSEFESQIYNNRISLDNANNTNRMQLAGIVDASAAGSMKCWYNAVRLGGNNGGGTGNGYNSLGFQRTSNANVDVRNNIFVNQRTGYGNHFAIVNTAASNVGWISDHNVLFTVNPGTLGVWGTSSSGGIRDFSSWQVSSLSDSFSVNQLPHFEDIATGQLELKLDSNCSLAGKGVDVAITVDYLGKTRLSPTDIGPYEFSSTYTVWSGLPQWNVPSNWCGRVPNSKIDVYIPEALTIYPTLEAGENAQVKNIIVGQLPVGR